VTLTVALSRKLTTKVTVNFSTVVLKGRGVATAGADFKAVSGTLSFAPGAQTATITVEILPDAITEPNEIFEVTLSKPSSPVAIGTGTSRVTIINGGITSVVDPLSLSQELLVTVNPNPATNRFRLSSVTGNKAPLQIRVFDNLGRIVEVRNNVPANSAIYLGQNLRAGVYYIEAVQGDERRSVKVIKSLN
jgi:hypothetical protein